MSQHPRAHPSACPPAARGGNGCSGRGLLGVAKSTSIFQPRSVPGGRGRGRKRLEQEPEAPRRGFRLALRGRSAFRAQEPGMSRGAHFVPSSAPCVVGLQLSKPVNSLFSPSPTRKASHLKAKPPSCPFISPKPSRTPAVGVNEVGLSALLAHLGWSFPFITAGSKFAPRFVFRGSVIHGPRSSVHHGGNKCCILLKLFPE